MPVGEDEFLDEDFGEDDLDDEWLDDDLGDGGGADAPADPAEEDEDEDDDDEDEEDEMNTQSTDREEDRTRTKGGERADDDRAAEAISGKKRRDRKAHQDELLDEGVEETFPASDPVSVKRIT